MTVHLSNWRDYRENKKPILWFDKNKSNVIIIFNIIIFMVTIYRFLIKIFLSCHTLYPVLWISVCIVWHLAYRTASALAKLEKMQNA